MFKCYEPTVAVDGAGRLWASDGVATELAVSSDGGHNWTVVASPAIVDPAAPAGASQTEVLLQASPDGTLYYSAIIVLGYVTVPTVGPTPITTLSLQVASTKDGGATWRNAAVVLPQVPPAPVIMPDRQWLAFAPDGDMYLTYNQPFSGITWIARSTDAGVTWGGWTRATSPEGQSGVGSTSGVPVVDSKGAIIVPGCDTTDEAMLVFVSKDHGATFTSHRAGAGCLARPMLAVAPDGVLVAAWTAGSLSAVTETNVTRDIFVATSSDGGSSWSAPARWGTNATGATAPWPLPSPDGSLALAYFRTGQWSELHVATGARGSSPEHDILLADDIDRDPTKIARTDYANLVRLPDGQLATPYSTGADIRVVVQT